MKHAVIFILYLIFNASCNAENNKQILLETGLNNNTMQVKENNEAYLRNEVYKSICDFDKIFKEEGKEIYFSEAYNYYVWYVMSESGRESKQVSDSVRFTVINESLNSSSLRSVLTEDFYNKINLFKNTLNDPVSLGYLLTNHKLGKSLLNILSDRYFLNMSVEFDNEDPSKYMSEQDYVNYHKERIHIVNDSLAVYKNRDVEISLEENYDVCYFIFKKEGSKWLLDDIKICKAEEEEQYDLKLIGKSKPLEYYKAKEYVYPE